MTWNQHDEIGEVFMGYFQEMYSSSGLEDYQDCLSVVQPRVSHAMNERLLQPFLPKEVDSALSQMHPLKAPGPDGFRVSFYQKHWETVGGTMKKAVLDFLNLGIFGSSINSTYIALIPKVSPAMTVSEFRPISLCNVLYKLIAKVLANQMKKVLLVVISQ